MKNNVYESIKEKVILSESKNIANNKKEWEKYLKSFIIDYSLKFKDLYIKNKSRINGILKNINLENIDKTKVSDQESTFLKSLFFLKSGMELFDIKNNYMTINFDNFNQYNKFVRNERVSFEENLILIEKEYEMDGIVELELFLQFIINFYKDVNVRQTFYIDFLKNTGLDIDYSNNEKSYDFINHEIINNNYMTSY